MRKTSLINLGCAKNLVDSEIMLGYLDSKGYEITTEIIEADIIIVNTCGFINEARKESESAIRNAIHVKLNAEKKKMVIVTGCYAERCLSELKDKFPEVDRWTGVKDFDHITDIITGASFQRSDRCYLYDHKAPRYLSTPPSWAYIKISEGCSHKCSFCAIPLIKGDYRSRPIPSIVEEASMLSDKGIKEINIISQDSTYFGRDLGLKNGLTALLQELSKIKKIKWIRVLYAYPEMLPTTHAAHVWFDKMRPTYEQFRCPDRTNFVQHEKGAVFRRVMSSEWFHRWLVDELNTDNLLWAPAE